VAAAVRARWLGRAACDLLADHCVAAAARRGLAGHLPCAALLLRNEVVSSTSTMAAAGWCWCLFIMNSSIVVYLAQPGSLDVLELVGKVGCAGWRASGGQARWWQGLEPGASRVFYYPLAARPAATIAPASPRLEPRLDTLTLVSIDTWTLLDTIDTSDTSVNRHSPTPLRHCLDTLRHA